MPTRAVVIFYVEKNSMLQHTVRDVLEFAGWHVQTCADSCMALALAESDRHFDLFIFSNELDVFSGAELTRRVRRKEHRRQTPVIIVSLFDRADEARRAGADAFLRKPNNLIELIETIRRLLVTPADE